MKISISKKQIIKLASIITMVLMWKVAALYFNSTLILPHPEETLLAAFKILISPDFVKTAGATIFRGILGFIISFILGLGIGILAGIYGNFNTFLTPFLVTIRSIPVVSLILLALIWFNSGTVPIFIALLTMFPFICTNVIEGVKSVDPNLVIMAKLYRADWKKIICGLYIPAISPFIISGASSAMGIGWRAIIIGEVLSQPQFGIGTKMQTAQIFLNVDALIAWTLIAIILSFGFEKLIRLMESHFIKWKN